MYNRILTAVDGSDLSDKVLEHAVTIAEKFGSELKILTVVPYQYYYGNVTYTNHLETIFFDIHDRLIPIYKKVLDNAEAKVRSEYPDLYLTTILLEGRPSLEIISLADKEECDLIIMGCRRIGSILAFLEESTSRSVLAKSKIPVLVIS